MPKLRNISGEETVKILCNKFGFQITGQSGSHVRLSRMTPDGKIGTVVPMHPELKPGTLKSVLRLAKVDADEFAEYI
ncbi:MAG: type II toxin-antitoxin system HicA family toxin [Methanothrix sp.]|nr:MAG: type II toxin-antitoxin system HicA family toxin [Methanothrix sp.]